MDRRALRKVSWEWFVEVSSSEHDCAFKFDVHEHQPSSPIADCSRASRNICLEKNISRRQGLPGLSSFFKRNKPRRALPSAQHFFVCLEKKEIFMKSWSPRTTAKSTILQFYNWSLIILYLFFQKYYLSLDASWRLCSNRRHASTPVVLIWCFQMRV